MAQGRGPEWPPITEASRMGVMEAGYGDRGYGKEADEGGAEKEGQGEEVKQVGEGDGGEEEQGGHA